MSRRGKMAAAGDDVGEPMHVGPDPLYMPVAPELSVHANSMILGWQKRVTKDVSPAVILDVIRQHSPDAFRWLMLNDTTASGVAIKHDWLRPETRSEPDAEELAAVRAACAAVEAASAQSRTETPKQAQDRPALSRRQLVALLATWKRDATKDNGGFIRIAALEAQLAAMDKPAPEAAPEPTPDPPVAETEDAPWVPSALAA